MTLRRFILFKILLWVVIFFLVRYVRKQQEEAEKD
jgi:preprotein translocase subunit YajC